MKTWIRVGAIVLLTRVLAAEPAATLTLDEAQRLAAGQNRQILASRKDIERQEHLWDSTSAQRFPKVSTQVQQLRLLNPITFSVLQGSLGSFPETGPIPAQNVNISDVSGSQTGVMVTVTQPLTQLHKLDLGLESQELEIDRARFSTCDTVLNVSVQVQQVYLGVVDTQNALAATKDSLDFAKELERVTQEYLKEKTVIKADLLDVQSLRAQQQYQLDALQRSLLTQKEQLNHLLGRDLSTDFTAQMPVVSKEVQQTIQQLQLEAQQKRPDLGQARARLKQAVIDTEVERTRYIPDVGLQFAYQTQSNSGLLPGSIMSLALVASWDILDWGERDADIAAKSKQAEAARLQLSEAESKAALEVSQKFRLVQDLQSLLPVRRLQVNTAEEHHRVALARYQVKATLAKDVLVTQARLTSARRDFQKWQIDLAQSVAELYQAVGKAP